MSGTSATMLYIEDGVVKCGSVGRSGGKCCGKPVVIDGKVVHAGRCPGGLEFTIAQLLHAAVDAGQTTVERELKEYFHLAMASPPVSCGITGEITRSLKTLKALRKSYNLPALPAFSVIESSMRPGGSTWTSPELQEQFGEHSESATGAAKFASHQLTKSLSGQQITEELGGGNAAVFVSQVCYLIDNDLLDKNRYYLFPVINPNDGQIWVLYCNWDGVTHEWFVCVCSPSSVWPAGDCVLSP